MFHANQGEWEIELTGAFYSAYSCLPALDITSLKKGQWGSFPMHIVRGAKIK